MRASVSYFVIVLAALSVVSWVDRAVAAESPQLSLVVTRTGSNFVAEVLSDTPAEIKVLDISTGVERTIAKSDVKEVRSPLPDAVAISQSDLSAVMAWKASHLAGGTPTLGKVAKITDNVIYLTLGRKNGIAKGQTMNVFRDAGEIVDPGTKKVIARERPHIAQLEVIEVQDAFSKAKLIGDLEVKLQVGDEVETIPRRVVVAVLPLVDINGTETEPGVMMAETLTNALVSRHVTVVEREMILDGLKEAAIQRTGLFDPSTVQKLGKQIGASMVMTGRIVGEGNAARAFVRMFDVESGEVVLTSSQTIPGGASSGGASAAVTARETAPAGKSASAGAISTNGPIKPPPDEKVIAEDKHEGLATNHPSFTHANHYVMKIDPKDPLVRLASTAIYYQALQPDDLPNTQGNVSISTDYGKTWVVVDKWGTESTKRAKRWDNWHVVDLAPVFKKKPDTEGDELQVSFDVDGIVEMLKIHTVIWAHK